MEVSNVIDRIDRTLACISEFVSHRYPAAQAIVAVAIVACCWVPSGIAQTVTGSGTSGDVPVFTGTSTLGNSPLAVSGGNVGIGTTSPQAPLDVNGAIRVAGSSGLLFSTNASVWLQENYGPDFGLGGDTSQFAARFNNSDGTTVMDVRADGLIGIGTTSPAATLDIATNASQSSATGLSVRGSDSHFLRLYPSLGSGNYNNIVQAGDQAIVYSNAGAFVIAPWADATSGLRMNGNGNIGIGTASPGAALEVDGSVKLTSGSGASLTFADGTVQSTAYTGTCTATGGDYAESMEVTGERSGYEPGDVMVLAKDSKFDVTKSSEPYSTMVAGIYSTKPGYVGRRQQTDPKLSSTEIPMAMVGVVPTKVSAENGPIHRGDLLVTATKSGYAMRGTNRRRMMGAVVGKAMGSLDSGTGVIDVLVSLQ